MSHPIHLKVMTPEKMLLDVSGVLRLKLRLADGGLIGILPGHAPLIAQTETGSLSYRDEHGDHEIQLRSGILHVELGEIILLTSGQHLMTASPITPQPISYDRLAESLPAQLAGEGNDDAQKP